MLGGGRVLLAYTLMLWAITGSNLRATCGDTQGKSITTRRKSKGQGSEKGLRKGLGLFEKQVCVQSPVNVGSHG